MKHWKVITIGILGLLLFPLLATAVNGTVPYAPGTGYILTSTTTGAYVYVAGAGVSGNCVKWGANNSLLDVGSPCSSGSGSGNVSTSTHETAGGIAYWTSNSATPALLGEVATSTLTPASPLTGSFVQIGSSGSLGCQTASGSQAGCLSSTDWTTFNNKQSALTFNYPLSNSGGTVSVVATSTTQLPLFFATSSNAYAINQSSGSVSGYLSSTDWTTFNGKQANLSLLAGTYSNGDVCTYASSGTLLNCNTALPTGTVTSVTGTYPIQSTGGTTPVISTAFGTTTTAGIGNDLMLYTSHTGVIIGASTSTLNIGGNAGTATALQNARTINGVSFNGTANIVVASTTLLSSDNNTFTGNTIFVASTTHEAQVNLVGASSTLFSTSNLWDTALTSGDCVQASTNGLLTTTGSACGSGGGGGITALGNYATTTGTTISFSTSTQSFQGATFGQSIVMSTNGVLFTPIITGTLTAASSTLLSSDNNTFSGHTIFAASTTMQAQLNLQQASSTNFSASGTVYADNFYDTSAAGSSCIGDSSGILENGNCVASLASSGSTITVSSPTGNVNVDLNLSHANSWSALQTFIEASTTNVSASGEGYFGTASTTNLTVSGIQSVLIKTSSTGVASAYGGASACSSNNFVTTISALGATTCGTAAISGVNLGSNLNSLSVGSSLTGTSYNGSAAVSNWNLNMSNANSWSALQSFVEASTTNISASGNVYSPTVVSSATSSLISTNGLDFGNGSHGIRVYPGSSTTTINFY